MRHYLFPFVIGLLLGCAAVPFSAQPDHAAPRHPSITVPLHPAAAALHIARLAP